MKPYLIPMLAAYIGCECDYETLGHKDRWNKVICGKWSVTALWTWYNYSDGQYPTIRNLKLHLRPIEHITDEELLFMWKMPPQDIHISEDLEILKDDLNDFRTEAAEYADTFQYRVLEINYLRSIGILVDQVLIDEGYVELKTIA